jgi:Lon protease-like protein
MSEYLPLFPLNVVLFPEMVLPLHIFEQRYKEMIAECLHENSPFGVLYAHDNKVAMIGCTAEISQVLKQYSDGRLDLVAVGRKRFQVSFFDSEKTYLRASVDLLPNSVGAQEPSESLVRQALDLYAQASRMMGEDNPEEFSRESSLQGLAFKLASSLHLQNDVRQRILEARSEDQRLEELAEHLSALIPRLSDRQESAKRAGSNGRMH